MRLLRWDRVPRRRWGASAPAPRIPPESPCRARSRRDRRRSLLAALRVLDLLFDGRAIDFFAVARQRALPRADGFRHLAVLHEDIAEVILNHRLLRQRLCRLAQLRLRFGAFALLEQGPAEA